MTEAGKKWIQDNAADYKATAGQKVIVVDGITLLRAFVAEVKKRAADVISCDPDEQIATAFEKLTREILGER